MAKDPQDLAEFEHIFWDTLDRHAPHKTVLVRGNNTPHVTKELRKAIMLRTRLKNFVKKSRSEHDIERYRRQRNLVVKIYKNAKRTYYSRVNPKEAGKEKPFEKHLSRCSHQDVE